MNKKEPKHLTAFLYLIIFIEALLILGLKVRLDEEIEKNKIFKMANINDYNEDDDDYIIRKYF